MSRIMLVNALDPEEVRVAVLRDGVLDELFVETRPSGVEAARESQPRPGNIYKGVVVSFKRDLEAAFVEMGCERHGFLHVSDLSLDGGGRRSAAGTKTDGETTRRLREFLTPGREIVVQVKKEGIGEKGPSLTTFVGLPGRYLVLMPQLHRIGVSRRIKDAETRDSLKRVLADISPQEGLGFVIRTEARGMSEHELRKDADELIGRWTAINERARITPAPSLLWEEADLTLRALRDHLTADTSEVWVDSPEAHGGAVEFIEQNVPGLAGSCRLYDDAEPLFHRFGVEEQARALMEREVELPGGGTIVIDQTEALVAIDVNSGRTRHRGSSATMILKTNLEAAREIARQFRLRDIGGLIVIDFIDMESQADRDKVEAELRACLESDKARRTILPISGLGVLEMTRQRRRQALEKRSSESCPLCGGRGHVRSPGTLALAFLRELRWRLPTVGPGGTREAPRRVIARLAPGRALALTNRLRAELAKMEIERSVRVEIEEDPALTHDAFEIVVTDGAEAPRVAAVRRQIRRAKKARPRAAVQKKATAEPKEAGAPAPGEPAGKEAEVAKAPKKKRRRGKRGGRRHKKKVKDAPETTPGTPDT
jgi:ribonuclease E